MTEELIQGSDAWFEARCGKVTASRVADIVARTKSGVSASRATYMAQLIAERLTGTVADSYSNAAMQWGIDTEPQARAAYELSQAVTVTEVGLVPHPTIPMSAASPDGLVDKHGMLEIKCPNTATHIDTLLSGKVPGKYITQMQWQMACADRMWVDFASFDPRMPETLSLFVQRVHRDNERIAELEDAVRQFLSELDQKIADLHNLSPIEDSNPDLRG